VNTSWYSWATPITATPERPGGLRCQVRLDHLDLAVVRAEPDHLDLVVGGKGGHIGAEPVADPGEDRRRGDRVAQMRGQEADHLPANLQVVDVSVEVEPIQALDLQPDVTIEAAQP
jgi:hypothetical protein